jgi:hypothetical protein
MTPKEEARKIFDEYLPLVESFTSEGQISNAKQCSLIAVDEMISRFPFTDMETYMGKWCEQKRQHLYEVKKEIEKL